MAVLQTATRTQREPAVAPPSVYEVLRSPGQPVDHTTRSLMESRFGHDFSHVRVHTDQHAEASARDVHARAYTVGQDIVFGRGQYTPHNHGGRQLLAHELTHTLQQRSSSARPTSLALSQCGDASERQADDAAHRIGLGGAAPVFASTNVHLARQPADSPAATGPCGAPCGSSPWVTITPRRWMSLCNDTVNLGTPRVPSISGCMPGRPGKVMFLSGGWEVKNDCSYCRPGESDAAQSRPDPTIQVGFIQTVERALQGGVYFKRTKGQWENVGNIWFQVANQRDCLPTAKTDPWYGPDKDGNFGPQNFGQACPLMFDQPFVALPTHKDGGTLRRMRIDGVFNLWMVAKTPGNKMVFVHHWTIDVLAVAVLPDDADPCNFSQWQVLLGGRNTTVTDQGPGQGPKTPVLTGGCAKASMEKKAEE